MPKTIVITGGSGAGASGIGAELVRHFHEAGYRLAVIDKKPLSSQTEKIINNGGHYFYQADITDIEQTRKICRQIGLDLKTVHYLASSAGGALEHEFSTVLPEEETWNASLQLNLSAHYYMIKGLWPLLKAADGDRAIVLISSINAIQGYGLTAYSAAKAGLIGLMHGLAAPLGQDNIRINCLLPGTVISETQAEDKDYEMLARQSCLGRMADPKDVAEGAAFLLTQRHMTGSQIVIDGGQSIFRRQK